MLHLGSLARHGCSCSIRAYRSSLYKVTADVAITVIAVAIIAAGAALMTVFGLNSLFYCVGAGALVASGAFILFSAFVVGLFIKTNANSAFEPLSQGSIEKGSSTSHVAKVQITEAFKATYASAGETQIYHSCSVLDAKIMAQVVSYLQNRLREGECVLYQHRPKLGAEHIVMQKIDQGFFFCRTIELSREKMAASSREEFLSKIEDFISPIGNESLSQVSTATLSSRRLGVYRPKLNHIQVDILGEKEREVIPFIRRPDQAKTKEEGLIKKALKKGQHTFFILEKPNNNSNKREMLEYSLVIYANTDGKEVTTVPISLVNKLRQEVALGQMPDLTINPKKMPPIAFGKKIDAEILLQQSNAAYTISRK